MKQDVKETSSESDSDTGDENIQELNPKCKVLVNKQETKVMKKGLSDSDTDTESKNGPENQPETNKESEGESESDSDTGDENNQRLNPKSKVLDNKQGTKVIRKGSSESGTDTESKEGPENQPETNKESEGSSSESDSDTGDENNQKLNPKSKVLDNKQETKVTRKGSSEPDTDTKSEESPENQPVTNKESEGRSSDSDSAPDSSNNNSTPVGTTAENNGDDRYIPIKVSGGLQHEHLTDDEEVWMVQCPVSVKPETLKNKNLILGGDSNFTIRLKDEEQHYETTTYTDVKKSIPCILPNKRSSLIARVLQPAGLIVIKEKLQVPTFVTVPEERNIQIPTGLKIRHPLFGLDYKKELEERRKAIVNRSMMEQEERLTTKDSSHRKSHKHEKMKHQNKTNKADYKEKRKRHSDMEDKFSELYSASKRQKMSEDEECQHDISDHKKQDLVNNDLSEICHFENVKKKKKRERSMEYDLGISHIKEEIEENTPKKKKKKKKKNKEKCEDKDNYKTSSFSNISDENTHKKKKRKHKEDTSNPADLSHVSSKKKNKYKQEVYFNDLNSSLGKISTVVMEECSPKKKKKSKVKNESLS